MTSIALPPDLGIEAVADLKTQLDETLSSKGEVVLEAATIARLHSASLQLLAAFVRARHAAGRPTRFGAVADELRDSARILGLSHALGLDDATQEMTEMHA